MAKLSNTLSLSEINKYFYEKDYKLYWKISQGRCKKDCLVGTMSTDKYLIVRLHGATYRIHRILYQLYNKLETLSLDYQIDHIDGNPQNNNANNLRLVNHSQNSMNRGIFKNNTSGHKHIIIDKQTYRNNTYICYRVIIKSNFKKFSKRFPYSTVGLSEAINWRDNQLKLLHGEFMYKMENPL